MKVWPYCIYVTGYIESLSKKILIDKIVDIIGSISLTTTVLKKRHSLLERIMVWDLAYFTLNSNVKYLKNGYDFCFSE